MYSDTDQAALVAGFNSNWLMERGFLRRRKEARKLAEKKGVAVQGGQKVVGSPNLP